MDQMILDPQILRTVASTIRAYCSKQEATLEEYISKINSLSDQWQDDETFSQMQAHIRQMTDQCKTSFQEVSGMYPQLFEKMAELIDRRPAFTPTIAGYPAADAGSTAGASSGASAGPRIIIPAEQVDYSLAIKEQGKTWAVQLPQAQKEAIWDYTGIYYENINATMRGKCKSFDPGNRERSVQLHQALSQCRLEHPCTVYRGVGSDALGKLEKLPDEKLVGRLLKDAAFMSTSLNRKDAFQGAVLFEISVPQGARGAYVGHLSQAKHYESEVLFDCERSLKITGVRRDPDGRRIITAKMVEEKEGILWKVRSGITGKKEK